MRNLLIQFTIILSFGLLPHLASADSTFGNFIEIEKGSIPLHDVSNLQQQVDTLSSGYTIEIPPAFKVINGRGQIDIDSSLNRWDRYAEKNPALGARYINGRKFYPIRIRENNSGSGVGPGKIVYAPLDLLKKNGVQYKTVNRVKELTQQQAEETVTQSEEIADNGDYGSVTIIENEPAEEVAGTSDVTIPDNVPIPQKAPRQEAVNYTLSSNIGDRKAQENTKINVSDNHKFTVPKSGNLKKYCTGASQYFQSNGQLGKKGEILKREFTQGSGARSSAMKHLWFRNKFPGMENLCPKFNTFNDDQKLNFWIWYMAAIAQTESGCGRNAYNPSDPNGVSIGELQMPDSFENRKWRGLTAKNNGAGGCWAEPPPVKPPSYSYSNPPATYMAATENSLTCGVEVLGGVLCGFYKHPTTQCNSTAQKPYGHGFWAKLRGGLSGPIISNIRKFPLCK